MVQKRNQEILGKIDRLKSEHPLWRYRRIRAYLRFQQGYEINRKRVYRLMTSPPHFLGTEPAEKV